MSVVGVWVCQTISEGIRKDEDIGGFTVNRFCDSSFYQDPVEHAFFYPKTMLCIIII